MAKRFAGEFESDEQFDTNLVYKRQSTPFGDELRQTLRSEGVVIGGMLVVPDLARLATAMGLEKEAVVEAGQRIGAESDLDILSHATGSTVLEVSGYAIELEEAGPVIESEPNVDLSDKTNQSDLIERLVTHNDPQDVVKFLGDLASTLARKMPQQ